MRSSQGRGEKRPGSSRRSLAFPRELRQTVVLHDVVRLPREEIAARLGCPVAAVRERVNRARLHLFRSLRTGPAIEPAVAVSAEVAETRP